DPIWTGRSPVLSTTRRSRSASLRSALSTTVPSAGRRAPGPSVEVDMALLADRVVEGDELAPVGERGLDLDVVEHLGHPGHHLIPGEHLPAGAHQLGDGPSVASALEHPGG